MHVNKLRKVGGSTMLALPPEVLLAAKLMVGDAVAIEMTDKGIALVRADRLQQNSLTELLLSDDPNAVLITDQGDQIAVRSPYSTVFHRTAKTLAGRWKAPHWVFPAEQREMVQAALRLVYGEDGSGPVKRVRLRIHPFDPEMNDEFFVRGAGLHDTTVEVAGRQVFHHGHWGTNVVAVAGEDEFKDWLRNTQTRTGAGKSGKRPVLKMTGRVADTVIQFDWELITIDILRLAEPRALAMVERFPDKCAIVPA